MKHILLLLSCFFMGALLAELLMLPICHADQALNPFDKVLQQELAYNCNTRMPVIDQPEITEYKGWTVPPRLKAILVLTGNNCHLTPRWISVYWRRSGEFIRNMSLDEFNK